MSQIEDAASDAGVASSDFTLLEGLYQLSVNGHTQDWEFERLNNAVYERLLSSYGNDDVPYDQSKSALAGS